MQFKTVLPLKALIVNQFINCSEHTKALDKLFLTSIPYAHNSCLNPQMRKSFFEYSGFDQMSDDKKEVFFVAFLRRRWAIKVIADHIPNNILITDYEYTGYEINPYKTLTVWIQNTVDNNFDTASERHGTLLFCALWSGDFETCEILWNQKPVKASVLASLFRAAAREGLLETCRWLWSKAKQKKRNLFLLEYNSEPFRYAVMNEDLKSCEWLWEVADEEQKTTLLTRDDYEICLLMLTLDKHGIFTWLLESISTEHRTAISRIQKDKIRLFFYAGKLKRFEYCLSQWKISTAEEKTSLLNTLTSMKTDDKLILHYYVYCLSIWDTLNIDQQRKIHEAHDFLTFRQALSQGHLEDSKKMYEFADDKVQAAMLSSFLRNSATLFEVIQNGHSDTFQWIWGLLNNDQQASIKVEDVFLKALRSCHFDLCEWLFETMYPEQRALVVTRSTVKKISNAQESLVYYWLSRRSNPQEKALLLNGDYYQEFSAAMQAGRLKKCQTLWELAANDRDTLILCTRSDFSNELKSGRLEVPQWLWSVSSVKQRAALMDAIKYKHLRLAAEGGHVKVCQWLFTRLKTQIKALRSSLPLNRLDEEDDNKSELDLETCSVNQLINRSPHTKKLEKRMTASLRYAHHFYPDPKMKQYFFDYEGFKGMDSEKKSLLFEAFLRRRNALGIIAEHVLKDVWEIDYQYTDDEICPQKTLRIWLQKQLAEIKNPTPRMIRYFFYCAFEFGDLELCEAVLTPNNCWQIRHEMLDIKKNIIFEALERGQFNVCQLLFDRTEDKYRPGLLDIKERDVSSTGISIGTCDWISERSNDPQLLEWLKFEALRQAVITGNIEDCQRILEREADPQKKSALVIAKNYRLFTVALAYDRKEIFQLLLSSADQERQAVIREFPQDKCQLFYEAGRLKQFEMCRSLWDSAPPEEKTFIMNLLAQYEEHSGFFKNYASVCLAIWDRLNIDQQSILCEAHNFLAFREVASQGSIENCQKFMGRVKPEQQLPMLLENNCETFLEAFTNGHLEVCEWLFKNVNDEVQAAMVSAVVSNANHFITSLERGHFDLCLWFWGLIDEKQQDLIVAEMESIFQFENMAYRWLFRHANPRQQGILLHDDRYRDFSEALTKGKLQKCQWLWNLSEADRHTLINDTKEDFANAISNGHLEVCQWYWECAASVQCTPQLLQAINLGDVYRAAERGHFKVCDWILKILKADFQVVCAPLAQHPNLWWNSNSSEDSVDQECELDEEDSLAP